MKNLFLSLMATIALLTFTACNGTQSTDSSHTKSEKCGAGKCGNAKANSKSAQCGTGKCGNAKSAQCGTGKCGEGK